MRIIISERQYKLLNEQGYMVPGGYPETLKKSAEADIKKLGPHRVADILGIATFFIPYVGPLISTGIGLADAKRYHEEGDSKTAAMILLFPFLPLGKLVKLVPAIKKLGKQGMETLAKKLGKDGGKGLTQLEIEAVEGMATNKEVLNQEMKKISDDLTKKTPKSTPSTVVKQGAEEFEKRGLEYFKDQMKKQYPMTEKEASQFMREYSRNGGDFYKDFNKMGYGFSGGDNIWAATVLKYGLKPPVGKYLYHGTTSSYLQSIAKYGLDNSLGKQLNPSPIFYQAPAKANQTFATGDIKDALEYAMSSAEKTSSKPLLLRFENVNGEHMGFVKRIQSVEPNKLEFSLDNGATWRKLSTK